MQIYGIIKEINDVKEDEPPLYTLFRLCREEDEIFWLEVDEPDEPMSSSGNLQEMIDEHPNAFLVHGVKYGFRSTHPFKPEHLGKTL